MKKAPKPFVHREGFWRSKAEPLLPKPFARSKPWKGQQKFLTALSVVENDVETLTTAYKGWSTCRVCECHNGSAEYEVSALGTTWVWPCGYRHYIEAHNVRPSLAFQEFIQAVKATIAQKAIRSTSKKKFFSTK